MDRVFPYSWPMARPRTSTDEEPSGSATAKVLGKNLTALMEVTPELDSNPKMAKKTGMSASTIHRMRNGQVDATLRTLEKLAKPFKVQPWELLLPTFDPARRSPVMSEKVRKLLAEVASELKDGE